MKFDGSRLCVRIALGTFALFISILAQGTFLSMKAFAQDIPSPTKEKLESLERELREESARLSEECSTQQLTSSDITLTKLFPQLATFAPTQVRILKDHRGLGGQSSAEYVLNLENEQFSGSSRHFSNRFGHQWTTSDNAVRRKTVMEFALAALRVGIEEKSYKPRRCATDSYPSLEIQLQAGTQTLRIWSSSQGLTPWGIEFEKRSFVSDTLELGKALGPFAAELGLNKPPPEVQKKIEDERRVIEELRMRGNK